MQGKDKEKVMIEKVVTNDYYYLNFLVPDLETIPTENSESAIEYGRENVVHNEINN